MEYLIGHILIRYPIINTIKKAAILIHLMFSVFNVKLEIATDSTKGLILGCSLEVT